MTRGVADVLALYLDAPEGDAAQPGAPGFAASAPVSGTLAVPDRLAGLVEPFLVWNLAVALDWLGRGPLLRQTPPAQARAALLPVHASVRGLRRATRRLEAWPGSAHIEAFVYGEEDELQSASWIRLLGERAGRGRLIDRGEIATGRAFARAILHRQAIARHPTQSAVRCQLLGVAERLLQPGSTAGVS